MVKTSDIGWRIFVHGFVGFFLGPVVVIVGLIFSSPEQLSYSNSGFVLLLSVLEGRLVGASIGLIFVPFWSSESGDKPVGEIATLWDADLDT